MVLLMGMIWKMGLEGKSLRFLSQVEGRTSSPFMKLLLEDQFMEISLFWSQINEVFSLFLCTFFYLFNCCVCNLLGKSCFVLGVNDKLFMISWPLIFISMIYAFNWNPKVSKWNLIVSYIFVCYSCIMHISKYKMSLSWDSLFYSLCLEHGLFVSFVLAPFWLW